LKAQSGYCDPKIDVRGAVFKEDKILMVRELMDEGRWTLPGGWADINEPLSEAVEREVREEAGMIVKARKLVGVYDRNKHGHPPYPFHTYKIFVICDLIAEATPDPIERSINLLCTQEHVPHNFHHTRDNRRGRIRRIVVHLKDPTLATEFVD
jgi:ADP-ribose pyrophosphatase YjhB (NUDIX family)